MTSRGSAGAKRWSAVLVTATAIAWAGFFVHNVADLPGQTILSPESLYPTLVTVVLLILALVPRTRIFGVWALLVWSTLNVVGGVLTVLPLPVLPFALEQSAEHYAFHVLYVGTQVPIVTVAAAWLRRGRGSRMPERESSEGARR